MNTTSLPRPNSPPRVLFAGDREIAVQVLDFLLDHEVEVVGLLLPAVDQASHSSELRERCSFLPRDSILKPDLFEKPQLTEKISSLNPDFLLSVHFQSLFPPSLLEIPEVAALNLHPAYLPYNRGWHTPSWALLEDTPFGATLHVMTDKLDAGPIVHRKTIDVRPEDTAHTLYQRVQELELKVFTEAWPALCEGSASPKIPDSEGTAHTVSDLHTPDVQRIDLEETTRAGCLLDRLRALTTNRIDEAAYFERNGKRYRVQVSIVPDSDNPTD